MNDLPITDETPVQPDKHGWLPIAMAPRKEVLLYFTATTPSRPGGSILRPMIVVGFADSYPHRAPTAWQPLPQPPENK